MVPSFVEGMEASIASSEARALRGPADAEAATVAIDIIDEALFSFAGDEITQDELKQELRDALEH